MTNIQEAVADYFLVNFSDKAVEILTPVREDLITSKTILDKYQIREDIDPAEVRLYQADLGDLVDDPWHEHIADYQAARDKIGEAIGNEDAALGARLLADSIIRALYFSDKLDEMFYQALDSS